ncbi:unnamed protein product [Pylaiella littoralis]
MGERREGCASRVEGQGILKRTRRNDGVGVATILAVISYGALLLNPAVGAKESSRGYDADLTLFSPEGRLYQVEYVMRAVGHYGCPVVGVHGEGCCVVACRRDVPDELLVYPDSVSSVFRITDDIYSAATGLSGDVRYQVKRARLQALDYKKQYGSPMPSRLLTLAMADAAQVNTQHAALRPMACVSLVISVDDTTGPALFRVEPSGQVFQAWGTAAGRGSAASLEFLEETFKTAAGKGAGYSKADRSSESGDGKDDDEDFAASKPAGNDLGGGDAENNRGDEKGSKGWDKNADDSDDAISVGVRERNTSGGRGGDTGGAANEPPDGSDGGSAGVTGFGVVGEDATVELALQALSKASSSKSAPPLTDRNVEIAIASRDTGIRVCSRKEVKGFLGRMAVSADCTPKIGR